MLHTLIIGGGISGLALGRALTEKGVENRVLEATGRIGGVIDTFYPPGTAWQLNYGANTLFVDDEVEAFLNRAGLGPHWVAPSAQSKARYILKDGRYQKLPAGPISFLFGSFFSLKAKLKILQELTLKPSARSSESTSEPETVYSFFLRHFGQEVCDNAVQPFLAGIYAGDAHHLLMELVFPKLVALEQEYGSLLRGLRKAGLGAGRRKSMSFVMGMRELCEALADMTACTGQAEVDSLTRLPDGRWQAQTTAGTTYDAQNVVLALPSYTAAHLLAPHAQGLAQRLAHVHYAELAQVHLGFADSAIGEPLRGFGGLHPPSAGTFTSGVLWISAVLPMRAPVGQQLLVAFVGGEGRPSISGLSDEILLDKAEAELRQLYKIDAPASIRHLRRWERAIPQYDHRLLGLAKEAEQLEADNLYLHSNYIGGVSVQDCIKKSLRLAEKLAGR
jgi:protoporphyrinogen/coproporphyrinogen III oxidase